MIHLAQTSERQVYRQYCGAPVNNTMEASVLPSYDLEPGDRYLRVFSWWFGALSEATMWWGYIPGYIGDLRRFTRPPWSVIAVEKAPSSRAFRHAWRSQRCLIPVDAFYLWRGQGTKDVQRYCVRRQDGRPMCLAGLWDFSLAPKAKEKSLDREHRAFCLLTTPAGEAFQGLFDRAPLILAPSAFLPWVSPTQAEDMEIKRLLTPDSPLLNVYAVRNDAKNAELWLPIHPASGSSEPYGGRPEPSNRAG